MFQYVTSIILPVFFVSLVYYCFTTGCPACFYRFLGTTDIIYQVHSIVQFGDDTVSAVPHVGLSLSISTCACFLVTMVDIVLPRGYFWNSRSILSTNRRAQFKRTQERSTSTIYVIYRDLAENFLKRRPHATSMRNSHLRCIDEYYRAPSEDTLCLHVPGTEVYLIPPPTILPYYM